MLATTGDQDSSLTPSGQEWLGTTGTQQPLPAGTSLRGRSGGIRSNLSLRLAVGCADSGWTGGKVHRLDGPPNPREGARSGTANVATPTNQAAEFVAISELLLVNEFSWLASEGITFGQGCRDVVLARS
jgi:hypothetical protein